jgi:drug/metabolite transporter (DMT)-like permease
LSSQDHSTLSSKPASAYLILLLGVFAVSTASIFIRFAQKEVPSLIIATYRMALAGLLLAPGALWRERTGFIKLTGATLKDILIAGFFLALHFASWIGSLEYTSVVNSVVLVTTTPLWVALASPLILKEPVSSNTFWGLGLALIGGVVVGLSSTCSISLEGITCAFGGAFFEGKAALGNFMALSGAWFAAGYLIAGRRARRELHLLAYTFRVYSIAGIILIILTLVFAFTGMQNNGLRLIELFADYPSNSFLWLVLLAIVPQIIGHTAFNWSLAYLPATFVSVALLGEPIGSTLLAMVFLSEAPTALQLFGAVLILSGIVISSRQNRIKK